MNSISPVELNQLQQKDSGTCLIDVRTPVEYASVHAVGSVNLPLDRVGKALLQEKGLLGKTIYVICKSGGRSPKACDKLIGEDVPGIVNVDGGTDAWVAAGLPVVRGKASLSLERQVRVAAGLLVLIGILLALFVHSAFLAISGFVGCGLVFAGVTDWCGMGLLLAKMPWNQKA